MRDNEPVDSRNSIRGIGSSIPARRARVAWSVAAASGLVLIYVALDWATFIHSYKGTIITPWDPETGVLFAVIVRGGAFYGLLLFVGVLCADLLVRPAVFGPAAFVSAAISASAYTAAAMMARHYFAIDVELRRLRDIVILILTGMGGALIVAVFVPLLLILVGRLDINDLSPSILTEFVGDAIGVASVSPLTLRLWYLRRQLTSARIRSALPEAALYVALIAAGLWLILDTSSQHGSNFFYVLFLPVIIAAVRQGFDGACLSLLVTQIGLVFLLQRYSFDAATFTEFQTLMFVLTATALSVGAIVSEREQARRAFQDAEERLKRKEADAIRAGRLNLVSAMASALAHEINQPITAVRALARSVQHLLRGGTLDLTRVDHNLTMLVSQIDAAGSIVRRVREFLHRGPLMGDVDVRGLLDGVLVLIGPETVSAQVSVDLVVEDNLPPLRGDREQLEQVILNLVRNAIESIAGAQMRSGLIRLAAQRSNRPSDVAITVWDNGPGVSADIAARLFQPLTTSKRDGFGLGLSICGSIAAAHGGRVRLEFDRSRRHRIPTDGTIQVSGGGVTKDIPTIFVVDDQPMVRQALTEMLNVFGYSVEAHRTAEELLESLDPRQVGCIVADVRMPGMDGIELVQELSRRDIAIPAVIISGHADIAMAVAAIKAGAEDFIEKPIDDTKLVAAINRGLADRSERRQQQETMQDLRARFDRLTPREVQVFDLVVTGQTSASISHMLEISTRTVESYRVQIMDKMNAASIAALVRNAVRLGRLKP